jgi:acetyl esterase/lipase
MASFQAHVAAWLVRLRMKRALEQARDAAVVRRLFTPVPFPIPRDVQVAPGEVGGVAGEWVHQSRDGNGAVEDDPSAPLPDGRGSVLLYLHGGGYIACSAATHRAVTVFYAQQGFRVFAPNYRLAPEHRFPAAVEDALAVWRGMMASGARHIVISGESAGGGLCCALMLAARDAGLPQPAAAAVFSPFVDLACTGESMRRNARRCAMLSAGALGVAARGYLGTADPRNPLASPLYGDLRGLAPLMIHVGADEVLLDDSARLAELARGAGVPVALRTFPVVPHAWQLAHRLIPEARESLAEASGFLQAAERAPVA